MRVVWETVGYDVVRLLRNGDGELVRLCYGDIEKESEDGGRVVCSWLVLKYLLRYFAELSRLK